MRYDLVANGHLVAEPGDAADLRRCVWLTTMTGATRQATLASLSTFCSAAGEDGELSIERIRHLITAPGATLKAAVGRRWSQVASDVRRALRAWHDRPTRWLALQLRDRIPTLADAATAAGLRLGADEAKRAVTALEVLAASEGGTLEDLPATAGSIEPLLRAATPETFQVGSMKSLENKRTLVRKVVRLVDPVSTGMREASVAALPARWRETLTILDGQLKEHERSQAAILRRLAGFSARQDIMPIGIDGPPIEAFLAIELATHTPAYAEKLRAAFRRWNDAVDSGLEGPRLPLPGAPMHRQETVDWQDVPAGIRMPVDAFLETAVSVRNPGDWGDLVPDEDVEYADLGISFIDPVAQSEGGGRSDSGEGLEKELARRCQARLARRKHGRAGAAQTSSPR